MNEKYIVVTDGMRLDRYLRSKFPGVSQSFIEKSLRKGSILLNGAKASSGTRVSSGDLVGVIGLKQISVRPEKGCKVGDYDALLAEVRSAIIYQDENIIAINKPAGMSVQGGTRVRVSICDVLNKIVPGLELHVVHRLDKDTSGVLILAKNLHVTRGFAEELRGRRVHKEYVAITDGVPASEGEISVPIFYKKQHNGLERTVEKEARTRFFVIKSSSENAMLSLNPITGRKHQIRIHLSSLGCPIIGDKKYNRNFRGEDNLHLHASKVTFEMFRSTVEITAPIPSYIRDTEESLFRS